MASIINASTSGAGGLIQTADSSGVLALQSAGTTIASVSGTGVAVTGTVADSLGTLRPLISGAAVASTSGTSIDFTGIPSWVKRVNVMFGNVSTNGSSNLLIQLGTSGGIVSTGYVSRSVMQNVQVSSTAGFIITYSVAAGSTFGGIIALDLLGSNLWTASGILDGNSNVHSSAGTVTLSSALTTVRVTTVNGTDTFDAGSINIMYE
jgi:hypothetical protein